MCCNPNSPNTTAPGSVPAATKPTLSNRCTTNYAAIISSSSHKTSPPNHPTSLSGMATIIPSASLTASKTSPALVFQGFDKQRRQRPIRRAEKTLTPFYDLTPEDFALFHADYWASRGEKDLLSYEFIVRIVNAALSRQQGLLLGLKDPDGRLHAARFVVFDNRCAYSLLSALNPSGHHNGASPLLFWHIIQQLASRTKAFDFEGSMDPSIAFSYSLYGATPTTYPHVTRFCNPIVKKLLQHKI